MLKISERVHAAMIGHLVADATGVPYEFRTPDQIPPAELITPESFPDGIGPRTYGVPLGTWSDDGATMLALADSLATCGRFDARDFGARLVAWYRHGEYTPDGNVFDIGNTTRAAIVAIEAGTPAERAGLREASSNGNGSLMRVLPLALWHRGTDTELVRDAMASSRVTHAHELSQGCCAMYALAVRRAIQGRPAMWGYSHIKALLEVDSRVSDALLASPPKFPAGGSGYVSDSLAFAMQVTKGNLYDCEELSYVDAVRGAIRLGRDTDTTAAIAGGLVAARDGLNGIPETWRKSLRGAELAEKIIARLIASIPSE